MTIEELHLILHVLRDAPYNDKTKKAIRIIKREIKMKTHDFVKDKPGDERSE